MSDEQPALSPIAELDETLNTLPVAKFFGTFAVVAAVCIALTHSLPALRYITDLIWFLSLLSAIGITALAITHGARQQVWIAASWAGSIFLGIQVFAPSSAYAHPIFHTPLSGESRSRPAILVDVLDESEFWGTAELYLKVQSSRFPSEVAVMFPINRGDFLGCRSRYIQLPFEVEDSDLLLLDVLDDQSLSTQDEQRLLKACESAGYCLIIAGSVCRPDLARLIEPGFMGAAQVIGDGLVMELRSNPFRNMGSAKYIIQSTRPSRPQDANSVTLLSSSNYGRAQVRMYFPP